MMLQEPSVERIRNESTVVRTQSAYPYPSAKKIFVSTSDQLAFCASFSNNWQAEKLQSRS